MRQNDIDKSLRLLDKLIEQFGEPGGYDAAVRTIKAAAKDQRPQTSTAFNLV